MWNDGELWVKRSDDEDRQKEGERSRDRVCSTLLSLSVPERGASMHLNPRGIQPWDTTAVACELPPEISYRRGCLVERKRVEMKEGYS